MSSATSESVLEALKRVQDPELHKDIVTLGMVKDLRVNDSRVSLTVELTTPACPLKDKIKADVEGVLAPLGVSVVDLTFGAQVMGSKTEAEFRATVELVAHVFKILKFDEFEIHLSLSLNRKGWCGQIDCRC